MSIEDHFLTRWEQLLAKEAEGLDFSQEEDRINFRNRVFYASINLKVVALRGLIEKITGHELWTPRDRATASKALANAWISRAQAAKKP